MTFDNETLLYIVYDASEIWKNHKGNNGEKTSF